MTLLDVFRLSQYAKKRPSVRVLVQLCASALGVKFEPTDDEKPKYMTAEEFKRFVQATDRGRVFGIGPR